MKYYGDMNHPKHFETHEDYLQYYRDYRKNNPKVREYTRKYNRDWRKKNGLHSERNYEKKYPDKYKAQYTLRNAVARGVIKRGNCIKCGKVNAQGHHPDYKKPLEVIWLCPIHHTELHRNAIK